MKSKYAFSNGWQAQLLDTVEEMLKRADGTEEVIRFADRLLEHIQDSRERLEAKMEGFKP